ncbi:YlzJ-like family protein [Halobacillus sp. Marseille-Q1614]|uniref:YlzJ-like family protein n=1 Tax=Halobacillus sp. Marseille-Q1614 TaxID=2709134 RepID=UPI0020C207B2|nr:YlzJ-like family protein [Halobacillus sp. Marseille-Q1614]
MDYSMILYTPLCEHDVFPQDTNASQIVYEKYNNRHVKCFDHGNGKKQIIQVVSTDPKDYLDPSLQPGQWLDY